MFKTILKMIVIPFILLNVLFKVVVSTVLFYISKRDVSRHFNHLNQKVVKKAHRRFFWDVLNKRDAYDFVTEVEKQDDADALIDEYFVSNYIDPILTK